MAINDFYFKAFTIRHQHSAMKVGTDGVLIGAWATLKEARRILDIGTGTGLLALMAAQRNAQALIDAIDIEESAVAEARENVAESIWEERISVSHCALQQFKPSVKYDYIISNPPFFNKSPKPEALARVFARHGEGLPVSALSAFAGKNLTENGVVGIIYPADLEKDVISTFTQNGLHLKRRCWVLSTPEKKAHRCMMEFSRSLGPLLEEQIIIEQGGRHKYSEAYKQLTKDFYLNF